jgi:hypothetical protein
MMPSEPKVCARESRFALFGIMLSTTPRPAMPARLRVQRHGFLLIHNILRG